MKHILIETSVLSFYGWEKTVVVKLKMNHRKLRPLKRSKSSHVLNVNLKIDHNHESQTLPSSTSVLAEMQQTEQGNSKHEQIMDAKGKELNMETFNLALEDAELEVMELECSQKLDELRTSYSQMLLKLGEVRRAINAMKDVRDEIRLLRGLDDPQSLIYKVNTWGTFRAWGDHLLDRFKKLTAHSSFNID